MGRLALPIYIPTLSHGIGTTAILPVLPLIALQLGFNVPQAAALSLIAGIIGVVGPIPAGRVMSRLGERSTMIATGFGLVVINVAAYFVVRDAGASDPTAWHRLALIACLVAMAVTEQVWVLGRQAYLAIHLPAGIRPRGMSLFGGMYRIGSVVGPVVGAAVIAVADLSAIFLVDAAAMTVATVLVIWKMVPGEGRLRHARTSETPREPFRQRWSAIVKVGLALLPLTMGRINRPLILPLLGASLGVDAATISLIFGAVALLEILTFVPAGIVMERFGRTVVMVIVLFGTGVGYVVMAGMVWFFPLDGAGPVVVLAVSAFLIALGNGLGAGIGMTMGIDIAPQRGRTEHLARYNAFVGVGRLGGPGIVSGITVFSTLAMAGFVTGVVALVGVLWAIRVLPALTPRPPRGPFSRR